SDDTPPAVRRDDVVIDRQLDHLGRAPKHERLGGILRDEIRDDRAVARSRLANRVLRAHQRTSSRIPRPYATSSRVAPSGGRRRTVYSPAVHVSRPLLNASLTTCAAVPMTSIPHM